MKRTKVLAAFLLVVMLLAIAPVAAMAATTPVGTEQYIVGPTYVAPGGTGTYNLYEEGDVYADGSYLVENMSTDPYYSYYIYWQIDALGAALAPGTTITANGVGVLTIDPNETATVINIIGYDAYYGFATSITVYIGTPPVGDESSYWLNVYTQMKAQGNNSSFTADGAENELRTLLYRSPAAQLFRPHTHHPSRLGHLCAHQRLCKSQHEQQPEPQLRFPGRNDEGQCHRKQPRRLHLPLIIFRMH